MVSLHDKIYIYKCYLNKLYNYLMVSLQTNIKKNYISITINLVCLMVSLHNKYNI